MEIKGIDVSYHNGTINWASVADSGVKFAMVRSSYGTGTTDVKFAENAKNAKDNGIYVGVYHYSYAMSVDEAKREANYFLSVIDGYEIEYPVVLDIEDPSQQSLSSETLTDMAIAFMEILENAGYYAMIYSSKYWFDSVLDDSRLTPYDHWVAQWSSSLTYGGVTNIWQYTDSGSVSGISSAVDMNTSYVDYGTVIRQNGLNHLTPAPAPTPVLDNTPDAYAKSAVDKAVDQKIIVGDDNGNLHLHDACTRQDLMVFFDRLGLLG